MGEIQSFGQWLHHRRRELDLTQDELARGVGCAPITIRKLEADQMRPSKQLAELLVDRLGVPLEGRESFVRFARGGSSPGPVTAAAPRHNLPYDSSSSFVGRERDLKEVVQLLQSSRLATLTGVGGIGKTRLAIQIGRELIPEYRDGVWLVDLAPLSDPALVPSKVAGLFSLYEAAGRPILDSLIVYLHSKNLLLILDSCEHLIVACAELAESLLRSCPDLRVLTTSREALRIEGERLSKLSPLTFPDPGLALEIENLSQYAAIQLFVDRAVQVKPAFQLTGQNAPWIAEISRRLDGIPLAIELAAARLSALSVEEIAARLADRFNLLTVGSRTALPRHQTLRATLDWSYALLTEKEQTLMRRLSVFAGGWTLEVAKAVCAGDGIAANEILDLQSALVNKSLVVLDQPREQGATTRYRILETIRQFAQEKLAASDEDIRLRDRHLKFFTEWTERVEPKLRGPEQAAWWDRMEIEHDNLRSALVWSLAGGDARSGLRLAGAAGWFWLPRGYDLEGLKWLQELLALAPNQERTRARAKALLAAVLLDTDFTTADLRNDWLNKSLEYWREVGDKWWIAYTLMIMGREFLFVRNLPPAEARLEEAVRLAREVGDEWLIGNSLRFMGIVVERYDYAAARAILEESISILKTVGDRWRMAEALRQLSIVALGERDYLQAASLSEEALRIFRDVGERRLTPESLAVLAMAMLGQGNILRAAELARECVALARIVGDKGTIAIALMAFAGIAGVEGQPRRSAILLTAAEALLNSIGLTMSLWRWFYEEYERFIASAREQLDETEFMNAMAEGKAMTMDQAIDYAMADVKEN